MKMTTRPIMDTNLRFSQPLHCAIEELDSVLDCYSPKPQGHWPVRPKLVAPLKHYEACKKVLEAHQSYETVGDYLLSILRAADSTASSHLEKILVK